MGKKVRTRRAAGVTSAACDACNEAIMRISATSLPAYSLVRDDAARRCFLISIGGESVHDGQQFGREGAVPPLNLHQVAHAVLDQRENRREVLLHERSPVVIEGSCVCTGKRVCGMVVCIRE